MEILLFACQKADIQGMQEQSVFKKGEFKFVSDEIVDIKKRAQKKLVLCIQDYILTEIK